MSYIGQGLPADVFSGFTTDSFTGDNSATTFTLSKAPFSEDGLIVVINNVIQKPTTNFTVSGTTLTIVGSAVATGDVIYAIHTSGAVPSTLASKVDVNGLSDGIILDADADTTISADSDDQIDFKAGGTDIMSLTATTAQINDGLTITVDDNSDALIVQSTDADASAGPILVLDRASGSPADSDLIGRIVYRSRNDAGENLDLVKTSCFIVDASDGTEDTQFEIDQRIGGTYRNMLTTSASQIIFNEDSQDIDFRVESNSNTHMLFVDAGNDRVGINTSSANSTFHVVSGENTYTSRFVNSHASGPYGLQAQYEAAAPDSGSDNFFFVAQDYNGSSHTVRLVIYGDGDVKNHDGTYGTLSDERIKQNIVDANSQWDDIKALQFKNFKKKDDVRQYGEDNAPVHLGLIAQELKSTSPRLVDENHISSSDILSSSEFGSLYEEGDTIPDGKKIGDVKEVKEKVLGIKYSILYMKAVKALQEAMAKIETLETKVKALEDA